MGWILRKLLAGEMRRQQERYERIGFERGLLKARDAVGHICTQNQSLWPVRSWLTGSIDKLADGYPELRAAGVVPPPAG